MGWRIHRIWSTEWFHDRNRAIERVVSSVSFAEARPIEESVQGAPIDETALFVREQVRDSSNPSSPVRRYQTGVPYRRFTGSAQRDLLLQSQLSNELAALVIRVVEAEGPIHEDLLAERLKDVCGIERAGSNVQSNVGEAVHIATRLKEVERRRQRNFLWKKEAHMSVFRVPTNAFRRPIDWIHRDEIALAILYLVEDQFGVSRGELGRGVARLFGLERATTETCDHILEVADELAERGLLRTDADHFSLPE